MHSVLTEWRVRCYPTTRLLSCLGCTKHSTLMVRLGSECVTPCGLSRVGSEVSHPPTTHVIYPTSWAHCKRVCDALSIGIARPKVERTDVLHMLLRIRTAPLTTFAPLGRVSAMLRMITQCNQSERSERDSKSSDPYGGIENHSHLVIDFRHFCHFFDTYAVHNCFYRSNTVNRRC